MAAKRHIVKKSKKENRRRQNTVSSSPCLFTTLISQIRSQQGLKLPVLKSLYNLLTHFSLNQTIDCSNCELALESLGKEEFNECGFVVKFSEISILSDVLFEKLLKSFNHLLYAFQVDISASQADRQDDSGSSFSASIEELTLLLRCCMVNMTLLVSDQNLLEKGQILLGILSRLSSTEINGHNEKISILFTKLLEVFADELLMHKLLREYFVLIDSTSSTSKMFFMCNFGHGDLGIVLELIAAHFILSVSDEQAFEAFLNRLFWQHGNDFKIPEMSLISSLSLLLNPIMPFAPKMFEAYLILLVSETIGSEKCAKYLKPDIRIIDCYLTAFEMSIILYTRHMSSLLLDGHPIASDSSTVKSCKLASSQLDYESFLQPATRSKINHLVSKLSDSWDSNVKNRLLRTKSDLVNTSISYVKESLYLFDKQIEDNICSILTSIDYSDDICDTMLYEVGRSPQEICFLASILKLMSNSMSQAIWCLRHGNTSGCLKTLRNVSICKEYDILVHLVGSFQQFNIHLPVQKVMLDRMKSHPTRHKESKWMLLHFLGLLLSSYGRGLDFLVRDCIFIIMYLLDLFVFEEGDLIALLYHLDSGLEKISPKSSGEVKMASLKQRSGKRIASKFLKIQKLYLSKRSSSLSKRIKYEQKRTSEDPPILDHVESPIDTEEEKDEFCNGEVYLRCIQDGSIKSSNIDDLADFIECKPGKDYSTWLKDRERYRKWKCRRKAGNWMKWKKNLK